MIGHALVHAPRHAVHPVSERWVAAGFAVGSLCFFVGPFPGFVQLVGARADAWVFFAGTLFFNVSTFDVLLSDLSARQEDRLIWAPDAFGSACFLASAVIGYRASARPRTMAAINLAGCIFFAISAVAAYVVPDTGSILDLAAANWNTALGALCFFVGALMLARHHGGTTP